MDVCQVVVGPEVALNAATAVDFLSMAEVMFVDQCDRSVATFADDWLYLRRRQPCSTRMQYLAEAQLAAQAAIKHPSLLPRAHIPRALRIALCIYVS